MLARRALRAALLAALLVGPAACGNSRQEKAVDEIEAACLALTQPGTTLRDADIALRGADAFTSPRCDSTLNPLDSNDRCAPAQGDARCETFWGFYAESLCSPTGGCWQICEARVVQSDLSQNGGDAVVCASRFYRKQPWLF